MIMEEFDDLVAVIRMLQHRGKLPPSSKRRIRAKQRKVLKYLKYSRKQGTLS